MIGKRPHVIFVHGPADIPAVEHWAIFEGSSITTEADERSKTNPGHGYPASTERFVTYRAYLDQAEFEAEVRDLKSRQSWFSSGFSAARVTPVVVETEIKIRLKEAS
jgi:hypothetical protein